jgi:hypothetical protein
MDIGSTPCDEQALRRTAIATPKASQPVKPVTNPGVLAGFSMGAMAAKNKYLADSNKSYEGATRD